VTSPPSTTPLVAPLITKPEERPLFGSLLVGGSVKLTVAHHGSSVRGSIGVSQAGAGGRLEIDLLVKGSLLTKTHGSGSKLVSVGRVVRQSVSAGKVSFAIALPAQGRRALARHHSLVVTVRITLTSAQAARTTITRSITLRL
jgi:hypothetical protein